MNIVAVVCLPFLVVLLALLDVVVEDVPEVVPAALRITFFPNAKGISSD